MLRRSAVLACALSLGFGLALPAAAQPLERIVAVVNDEAISQSDLDARIALAAVSSNLPPNQETYQRLMRPMIRTLVDETLKLQAVKEAGVEVTDAELDTALEKIAGQNNLSRGQLEQVFAARRVPISTLRQQVRATIGWSKVVQRQARSTEIGEDEIDDALQRIAANAGKPEYLVAEIFLPAEDPGQDAQARQLAERLIEELRGGGRFAALASQFSQGAGASNGGDLGWVQEGQLAVEIDNTLQKMEVGQVSPPIRGFSGWHILLLREKRVNAAADPDETEVLLRQATVTTDDDALREEVQKAVLDLRDAKPGCSGFNDAVEALGPQEVKPVGPVKLKDLPASLREPLTTMQVEDIAPPITEGNTVTVIALCDRKMAATGLPSREEMHHRLGQEQMELTARRLLRDLRRDAFVDIRV